MYQEKDYFTEKGGCVTYGDFSGEDSAYFGEQRNYKDMHYTVGNCKGFGAAAAMARAVAGSAGQHVHARFDHLQPLFGEEFMGVTSASAWQGAMQACVSVCRSVPELGLCLLAACRSAPSRIACVADSLISSAHASGEPPSAKGRELLPIGPLAAEMALREAVIKRHGGRNPGVEAWGMLAVHALNFLACAGWCRRPVCLRASASLSRGQRGVIGHIVESVGFLLSGPPPVLDPAAVRDDLDARRAAYGGEVVFKKRDLVCDLVVPVWPAAGKAAVLPVEDFVDGELRDDLLDVQRCLLPRAEWPAVTPQSAVHASDAEWYKIVQVGIERGIFVEVDKADILRDAGGKLVLNGAMGVDKYKMVGGERKRFLRFISILVPSNSFLRRLRGGSGDLPYLGQLSLVELQPGEDMWIDSEDMESCFNLFRMPPAWRGLFAFSKQVPRSVVGGPASEMMYVAIQTVPMGWLGAVDVMQYMARKLVFETCGTSPSTELHKDCVVPPGPDFTIVCMDGVDHLRKAAVAARWAGGPGESPGHQRFVAACRRLGLPLNVGKSVVCASHGSLLGGELDGFRGWLSHSHDKSAALGFKGGVLLGMPQWSGGALQHWLGCFCFGASFRRPIFAALQETFTLAVSAGPGIVEPSMEHLDEVLLATLLLPFMFTDLRAPIRRTISCSDASSAGGGACEATEFVDALDGDAEGLAEDVVAGLVEEAGQAHEAPPRVAACAACGGPLPAHAGRCCTPGCTALACRLDCLLRHRGSCGAECHGLPACAVYDASASSSCAAWEVGKHGVPVVPVLGGQRVPVAAWVHWCSDALGLQAQQAHGRVLRDKAHPEGQPHLPQRLRCKVARGNHLVKSAVRGLESQLANGRLGAIELPRETWVSRLPLVSAVQRLNGVFFDAVYASWWGGPTESGLYVLHCSAQLHQALVATWGPEPQRLRGRRAPEPRDSGWAGTPFSFIYPEPQLSAEWYRGWCAFAGAIVADTLLARHREQLPAAPSLRESWLRRELCRSTARLSEEPGLSAAVRALLDRFRNMKRGAEIEHLRGLLREADYRGSDVRLSTGELVDGCRQDLPYPACAWKWKTVQAYPWRQTQHINVLEFTAFLIYVRSLADSLSFHNKRYFHVFDSRVVACVAAKGRSSSKVLNRVSRRFLAYALATNSYVLTLWTISHWNFSDAASRLHGGTDG